MNLNESTINKDITRALNESNEDKENDLQNVMKLLRKRLGVDVEFLGRSDKNSIKIGFEFSQKLKDETDKLSFTEQKRFEEDFVKYLGNKVEEIYIVNSKYGSNIVLRVSDDFDDGITRYDVDALIKNPSKAKEELKLDKFVEKVCDKLGSNIAIRVYVDKKYKRKEAVENEAIFMIETKNLVDEVGIMKSVFNSVNIEVWDSWVRANPKDGSLEAYADVHLSWNYNDGGSNGTELCTAYFSDGHWTI